MKIRVFTLLIALYSHSVFAIYDFSPADDKLKHFGVSVAVGFGANYVLSDWRYAFGTCAAIGVAKEVYDEDDYGGGSIEDIAYDLAGCVVGVTLSQSLGLNLAISPTRAFDGATVSVRYDF